jgi:hypothetical protein
MKADLENLAKVLTPSEPFEGIPSPTEADPEADEDEPDAVAGQTQSIEMELGFGETDENPA